MKIFLICVVFLVPMIQSPLFPQTPKLIGPPGGYVGPEQIAIHPQYTNLVYVSSGSGAVFSSTDGGNTIKPLDTGFKDFAVDQIALPYNEKDYIYIHLFQTSLMSINAGNSWNIIHSSVYAPHFTFNPLNSDIMFMIRDNKVLWRSNDKGITWFEIKTFTSNLDRISIAPSDTSFIYAIANNSFYKSINSGKDWLKTFDAADSIYFSSQKIMVNPLNKNSVYFKVGGTLYKTTDGGKSFKKLIQSNLGSFILNTVDTTIIYAILGDPYFSPEGSILKTKDGGENWFSIIDGIPDENLSATSIKMNPQNPEELYVGIYRLGVFKTINGGDNWDLTNLCYTDQVWEISISNVNPGELITTQLGWNIMKTNNNGASWFQPSIIPPPTILNYVTGFSMNPMDDNIGLLGGGTSLYKTIDGGNNWYPLNQLLGVTWVLYHEYNPNIVFASLNDENGQWHKYRSTDGGESWENIYDFLAELVFSSQNDSLIYGYGVVPVNDIFYHSIFKSADLGNSWQYPNNGLLRFSDPPNNIMPISCLVLLNNSIDTLYCGQEGGLSKSTDGGENWFQIDSSLSELEYWLGVSSIYLDSDISGRMYVGLLAGGQPFTTKFTNGGLYLTQDEGKSWKKIYDGEVTLIKSDNSTPRNIYFVTKFGIMTIVDTFSVTSVNEIESKEMSIGYELYQNYPNPFNPSTIIKYSIPGEGTLHAMSLQLTVYDILGKEVKTLVNEIKQPGNYEVEFDASNLSSGIYYYQLKVGEFIKTKKMVLLR